MSENKHLQIFNCVVTSSDGTATDISQNMASLDIYESLFRPYLIGDLIVTDNSNLLSNIPLMGQETVTIGWRYNDKNVAINFYAAEIEEIKSMTDSYGGYVIKLVSTKMYLDTINTFSRSYSGLNTKIISDVHADFLEEELDVVSTGGSSHQVVYPYIKPYDAIDMIIEQTYAIDNTPLFLYEVLNSRKTVLQSLGDMVLQDSIVLENIQSTNLDTYTGQGRRESIPKGPTIDDQVIKRAHPTFKNIRDGLYASNIGVFDLYDQSYREERFNYKDHTPDLSPSNVNYISDKFKINDATLDQHFAAKQRYYLRNTKATGQSAVGNLYNTDPISRTAMSAYFKTLNNSTVRINCDPHVDMEVGKLVDLRFNRMAPNLDQNDDRDPYRSGEYLCTAIKHKFAPGKYNLTIEAVRSGVAERPGE